VGRQWLDPHPTDGWAVSGCWCVSGRRTGAQMRHHSSFPSSVVGMVFGLRSQGGVNRYDRNDRGDRNARGMNPRDPERNCGRATNPGLWMSALLKRNHAVVLDLMMVFRGVPSGPALRRER
jgi:hypothetical protein